MKMQINQNLPEIKPLSATMLLTKEFSAGKSSSHIELTFPSGGRGTAQRWMRLSRDGSRGLYKISDLFILQPHPSELRKLRSATFPYWGR